MSRLTVGLRIWVRRNVKWLLPFVAAGVQAVRPWFLGTHFTTVQWLGVAVTILAAANVWVVPNVEAGISAYAKAFVVTSIAGLGATIQVWPGGISRPDIWTIGTAVAAALGTLGFRTIAPKATVSGGAGHLGVTLALGGVVSGLAGSGLVGESGPETVAAPSMSVADYLRSRGVRATESGAVVPMAGDLPD